MAIDTTRSEIEHIKQVLTSQGFQFVGYQINPNSVTVTISASLKEMSEFQKNITEGKLKGIVQAFKWPVTSSQVVGDDLVVTVQRERTVAGII